MLGFLLVAWRNALSVLPVVGEDILIVSIALSCFLCKLSDALLLLLTGFVHPHQPNLQNREEVNETGETENIINSIKPHHTMASTLVVYNQQEKSL